MLQLVYISTARGQVMASDIQRILGASRRNNTRDGISGLLFFDGVRFLQALEGEEAAVTTTYERIHTDPRHSGVVVLSRREVPTREFGQWAMASRTALEGESAMLERVGALVADASPIVQATFTSFAEIRRKAA
ncbi:BLUF domain-containing protein [uncultured Sphingomonas sp.]|uniref:BLUF domain-containing protein n=1 Tax=uncultured Sphingomonas sp. TaxID=158754 RepID=UPI0035CA9027